MSSPVEMSVREASKAFNFSLEREGTSTRAPLLQKHSRNSFPDFTSSARDYDKFVF
jgi:hypothetical protein